MLSKDKNHYDDMDNNSGLSTNWLEQNGELHLVKEHHSDNNCWNVTEARDVGYQCCVTEEAGNGRFQWRIAMQ